MNKILLLPLLLLIGGCAATKIQQVPIANKTIDTVVIKELIRDTIVKVKIEKEYIEKTTRDTVSVLSTELATSTASITQDGLHHTLEQKRAEIPTKIVYKDKIKEVIKYEEKEIPVEVIVEKKYIPQWCWYSLIGNIVIALLIGFRIYRKFRF